MDLVTLRPAVGAAESDPYLDRVKQLAPAITAAADQGERNGRLTDKLMADLHAAGMFRLLLPRPYGGFELDPASFYRTMEAVAALDASTAWCLCQGNGCAMTAAFFEPAVADEIWGSDPKAVLAWGPQTTSQAVVDGDGYRLSGNWTFASGGRHATWLGGHAPIIEADGTPRLNAEGRPVIRTQVMPASRVTWIDTWNVIGLRATGSDSFTVKDQFIPRRYSVARDDPADQHHRSPLYVFPQMSLFAAGFSGTALGIARSMLDAFRALADDKTPRLARSRLSDNAVVQAEVALCEARLRAARALLETELADIWQTVVATGQLSIADRMRIRLAATYAIHEAKGVADTVYDAAGATAIFVGGAFERRFRDIHTVVQQLQGRKAHFQTVGAFLLGHPPDMAVI